jgi:hypothetical protein
MFRFFVQVLFFLACFWLLMFVFGLLMPILTHPIATIIFCVLFVMFAMSCYKASQR